MGKASVAFHVLLLVGSTLDTYTDIKGRMDSFVFFYISVSAVDLAGIPSSFLLPLDTTRDRLHIHILVHSVLYIYGRGRKKFQYTT
ncbi:hypothetical protein V8F06_000974 [Rhypophila decipiens]